MSTTTYPHIQTDDDGTARLERLPRIRVTQIVADHVGNGWSVQEILRQYHHLRAAEVHAALAYYFDHREEIDAEITAELAVADENARFPRTFSVGVEEDGLPIVRAAGVITSARVREIEGLTS